MLKNGSVKFYAYKTYCYKSIIDSLETLLKRPGLEEQSEKWKSRQIDDDLYADVYDGQIWKQFGEPPRNIKSNYGGYTAAQ